MRTRALLRFAGTPERLTDTNERGAGPHFFPVPKEKFASGHPPFFARSEGEHPTASLPRAKKKKKKTSTPNQPNNPRGRKGRGIDDIGPSKAASRGCAYFPGQAKRVEREARQRRGTHRRAARSEEHSSSLGRIMLSRRVSPQLGDKTKTTRNTSLPKRSQSSFSFS